MMELIKKILSVLFVIAFIGFISYFFWNAHKDAKQLEREPIYTYGIIVDTYVGAKGKDYFRFKFVANGDIWYGDKVYTPSFEPTPIKIGDTCEIVYAFTNPEIYRVLENADFSINIRRNTEKKMSFEEYKKMVLSRTNMK